MQAKKPCIFLALNRMALGHPDWVEAVKKCKPLILLGAVDSASDLVGIPPTGPAAVHAP
jgi:hypothetical protein